MDAQLLVSMRVLSVYVEPALNFSDRYTTPFKKFMSTW